MFRAIYSEVNNRLELIDDDGKPVEGWLPFGGRPKVRSRVKREVEPKWEPEDIE